MQPSCKEILWNRCENLIECLITLPATLPNRIFTRLFADEVVP